MPPTQLTLPRGQQLSQHFTRQQQGTPSAHLENRLGRHCWWSLGRSADPHHKERFSLPPRSLETLHTTTTTITHVPWHGLCSLPCSADWMTGLLALWSCSSVLTVTTKHVQNLILHVCKSKALKYFSTSVSGQRTVILEQLPWGQHFHT